MKTFVHSYKDMPAVPDTAQWILCECDDDYIVQNLSTADRLIRECLVECGCKNITEPGHGYNLIQAADAGVIIWDGKDADTFKIMRSLLAADKYIDVVFANDGFGYGVNNIQDLKDVMKVEGIDIKDFEGC